MSKVDWEAIEREYRAGQLSIREIGRQYGVSHVGIEKHAKKAGWVQDLKEAVKEEVTTVLVPTIVTAETEVTTVTNSHTHEAENKAIVKAAAGRTLKLVQIHRADAQRQREILRTLMAMLRNRVPDDKVMLDFESLRDVSTVSRNAASALKSLVSIERQAYGLDVKENEGDGGKEPQEIKVNIISFGTVICGNHPAP